MFHPAIVSDDVSPLEANIDRMYWSSLLSGRMMPGLGLAASRLSNAADHLSPDSANGNTPTAPEIESSKRHWLRRGV